jgi:hypothetical protein
LNEESLVAGLGLNELRQLRQLRQLREENTKLKRLVADLNLDRHILQEIVAKNWKASCAARAGGVGTTGPPIEPATRGAADSGGADDFKVCDVTSLLDSWPRWVAFPGEDLA